MSARASLIVGSISTTATANNAFSGLGAAIFFVIALFLSLNLLINNADERARLRNRPEMVE
jgi:hypothetical protein